MSPWAVLAIAIVAVVVVLAAVGEVDRLLMLRRFREREAELARRYCEERDRRLW